MQKVIIIYHVLLLGVFTQSAFSQVTSEQKLEKAKNAIDKESKYLGDNIIVKQSIYYIEDAINSYKTEEILYLLQDRRKEKEENEALLGKKREEFASFFASLKNVYPVKDKQKIPHKIFRVSDINFTNQDSIIIADLEMEFARCSFDESGNPEISFIEKNDNVKNSDRADSKATAYNDIGLIHDTWVFEKIFGEWKLVTYNQLESTLNKYKSIK